MFLKFLPKAVRLEGRRASSRRPDRGHCRRLPATQTLFRGVKRKKMKSGPSRIFKWKTVTKTGVTKAGPGIDMLLDEIMQAQGRGQAQGAGAHGRRLSLTTN